MWACLGYPGGMASAVAQGLSAARLSQCASFSPPGRKVLGPTQVTSMVTSFRTEGTDQHLHQPVQKPEGVSWEETLTLT